MVESFTTTLPTRSSVAKRNARARSRVYTAAWSPRCDSFATASASSSPSTEISGTIGPNVSSRFTSVSRPTFATTVGW